MIIERHKYHITGFKPFDYDTYITENLEDETEFLRLFKERKAITDRMGNNKRVTAYRWAGSQVKLWGFFKSYPKWFNAKTCRNFKHPMQFYDITPIVDSDLSDSNPAKMNK